MNPLLNGTIVICAWVHSCPIHGAHVALYGTDCPDTALPNAEAIYESCCEATEVTGPMHTYHVSRSKLADLLSDSKNTEEKPRQ